VLGTRRYLITGGAGFIGSHLAEALVARGDRVTVLDDFGTGRASNLSRIENNPAVQIVTGTVLDPVIVDDLVAECDVVVHLAAAVGVRLVVDHPLESLLNNIRGAELIFDAAWRHRRPVLLTSTSEIYGKNAVQPLSEDSDRVLGSPRVARWSYSTGKAVDEILAFGYYEERGVPSIVVRLFNTVGPRQSARYGMVVPNLVRQAVANEPITVYGDGSQSRCFCHVSDVVEALLRLLDHPDAWGDVFNVGASDEVTIMALAERVRALTGATSPIRTIPYDQAYGSGFEDMRRRVPDTSKLRALTGWAPTGSLDDIVSDVIAEAVAELSHGGVRL
jgi:UDP-glucose 4-epimerase